jgi:hypothetical protein
MEMIRRALQNSVFAYQSMFRLVWPISSLCMTLGQHVRVGVEENLWGARKGERLTSVEMVRKAVRMAGELARPIATGKEAREILQIGTWYDSSDEALMKIGWPPNRQEGETGFRRSPPMVACPRRPSRRAGTPACCSGAAVAPSRKDTGR